MVKENKDTAYLEQCVSYRPKLIFFFCFFNFHPSNLFIKKKKVSPIEFCLQAENISDGSVLLQ